MKQELSTTNKEDILIEAITDALVKEGEDFRYVFLKFVTQGVNSWYVKSVVDKYCGKHNVYCSEFKESKFMKHIYVEVYYVLREVRKIKESQNIYRNSIINEWINEWVDYFSTIYSSARKIFLRIMQYFNGNLYGFYVFKDLFNKNFFSMDSFMKYFDYFKPSTDAGPGLGFDMFNFFKPVDVPPGL